MTRSPSPASPGEVENSYLRTLASSPFESLRPPDLSVAVESSQFPELPDFPPVAEPHFIWGMRDAASFSDDLNSAYKEVIQWRRNVFDPPCGSAG